MSYFDAENDLTGVVNAEAAVRYTEKQIRAKGKHYDWFCYDKREADKIRRVTGITATILDEGLLAEARGDFNLRRGERSDFKYINKILEDCIESLGGLTVYNAAKFLGITPQTVIPKLKKTANATQVNLSLYKRFRAGRPRALYIPKTAKNDFAKQRDALMLNLVLELLFKRDNLKIEMTGRELNIETKATGRKFQLICDSSFMRDSWNWDETLKETRRKILEGERQNKATIIAATIYIDAEIYKANFPKAYILDLNNPPR